MENQQKYKVWWDEQNQIIRTKFMGDQDEVSASSMLDKLKKIVDSRPGETLLLTIDLTEAGLASSGARKKFVEMAKLEKVKKQAQFGAGTVARMIASFVVKFAGVENTKMFATEQEALKWLKEEQT